MLDVYKNPFGLKSHLTPTRRQKTETAVAERLLFFCATEIIVFTNGRQKLRLEGDAGSDWKWQLEEWICWGENFSGTWRNSVFCGDSKGRLQQAVIVSSPERVFCFARICASSFLEHLLVCLLLMNDRAERRWRSYWVLCVSITSIWPHFQLNYICLTSSAWIHRTGHMGSTATGSEPKLHLLHYNIMSKEEKSFIYPW